MTTKLPSLVVTGASGFIGRFLLESIKDEFKIFAIARRSRKEANIPYHKNIHWIQWDVANNETLKDVGKYILDNGGAETVIHLAAFYDFTYEDNDEYERTNIGGTRNVLDLAKIISIKRFLFASSLAACNFPKGDEKITETTQPLADFAYARSKKKGEEMVKEYSPFFKIHVIRFAAVYSDWCEYAPLYKFLLTWLSKKIDSRILAGKGESSIPYIHVQDIVSIIRVIIKKSDELKSFGIYSASADGSVSHSELFKIATGYYFGRFIKPYYLPKSLAYPGLFAKKLLKYCHFFCEEPFEKSWMIKYIDKKLNVDSSLTRKILEWEPAPRYHITRRLLFILEKMKSHPDEWHLKNEAALKKVTRRENLMIYEALSEKKDSLISLIIDKITSNENESKFFRYKNLDSEDFKCYLSTLYHLLMATVRSGDRGLMIQYIDDIALRRFAEGFESAEICETLIVIKDVILKELNELPELKKIRQIVYDYIGLTLQLAQDEVEDLYYRLIDRMPKERISESPLLPDCKKLQAMIRQLSAFYQISPDEGKYYEDMQ